MEAVYCRKSKFGIEQIPFGKEHIHIARDTALVAEIGDMQSRAQGVDLLFLRLPLILNDIRTAIGNAQSLAIPYATRAWTARRIP
jgi:hypothetical protein